MKITTIELANNTDRTVLIIKAPNGAIREYVVTMDDGEPVIVETMPAQEG